MLHRDLDRQRDWEPNRHPENHAAYYLYIDQRIAGRDVASEGDQDAPQAELFQFRFVFRLVRLVGRLPHRRLHLFAWRLAKP